MSEVPGEIDDTVVDLQRLLESEIDLCESLRRLARRACGSDGSGIASSITMRIDGRQSTVSHHGAVARSLDSAQFDSTAGPGVDSLELGRPVWADPVDVERVRWPEFVEAATANGIRAAMSQPVTVDGTTLGALNLYSTEPDRFNHATADDARGFADEVAAAITTSEVRWMTAVLRRALDEALGSDPRVDISSDCERALIRVAELIVSDRSLRRELRRIAGSAVSMLPRVDGAGIDLILDGRPISPSGSDRAVFELHLARFGSGPGPGGGAGRTGGVNLAFRPTEEHNGVDPVAVPGVTGSTVSYPVMTSGRSLGSLHLHLPAESGGLEAESDLQSRAIAAAVASALLGSRLLSAADAFVAEAQHEAHRRRTLDPPERAPYDRSCENSGNGGELRETGDDNREEVGPE